MKKLTIIFGLVGGLALPCFGSTNFPTVYFNLKTMASVASGRAMTATPLVNPVSDGTNTYWSPALLQYPTNGVVNFSNMVPNTYTVTLAGAPGSLTLEVPWTNGYLNGALLTTNLLSLLGAVNVAYVTNVYFVTNLYAVTNIYTTTNAAGGAITNGQTNVALGSGLAVTGNMEVSGNVTNGNLNVGGEITSGGQIIARGGLLIAAGSAIGNGESLTNLDGGKIQAGTVKSNSIDAGTWQAATNIAGPSLDWLKPRTNIVRVNMQHTNLPQSGTWLGGAEYHALNIGTIGRMRQSGVVEAVEMILNGTPAPTCTNLFLEFWRESHPGSNFTRIYREDVLSKVASGTNRFALATNLYLQFGDYVGYGWKGTLASSVLQAGANGSGNNSAYTTVDQGTFCKWRTNTHNAGIYPIYVYMKAPTFAFLGDSICVGAQAAPNSYVKYGYVMTNSEATTYPYHVARAFGASYQNLGSSSDRLDQIELAAYGVGSNCFPKTVIIEGGINDVGADRTELQVFTSITNLLNWAQAREMYVVWLKMFPSITVCIGAENQLTNWVYWNSRLDDVCAGYTNVIALIDVAPSVGAFCAAGPAGNLWSTQAGYTEDNIHFLPAGYELIGNYIANALLGNTNDFLNLNAYGPSVFYGGVEARGPISGNGVGVTNLPYAALNTTNVPEAGWVLKFDGTNMYWAAP